MTFNPTQPRESDGRFGSVHRGDPGQLAGLDDTGALRRRVVGALAAYGIDEPDSSEVAHLADVQSEMSTRMTVVGETTYDEDVTTTVQRTVVLDDDGVSAYAIESRTTVQPFVGGEPRTAEQMDAASIDAVTHRYFQSPDGSFDDMRAYEDDPEEWAYRQYELVERSRLFSPASVDTMKAKYEDAVNEGNEWAVDHYGHQLSLARGWPDVQRRAAAYARSRAAGIEYQAQTRTIIFDHRPGRRARASVEHGHVQTASASTRREVEALAQASRDVARNSARPEDHEFLTETWQS